MLISIPRIVEMCIVSCKKCPLYKYRMWDSKKSGGGEEHVCSHVNKEIPDPEFIPVWCHLPKVKIGGRDES